MGVNVVALLATVLALGAGALSILLLTTTEFVEVFVQEPNDKLSCRIGYLGVYEAGFDSGCLSDSVAVASKLGSTSLITGKTSPSVEAFESDTTEFSLLFPSQTDFYADNSPLGLVTGPTPKFDGSCEKYAEALDAESTAYSTYSGLLNGGIFGSFVTIFAESVFEATFSADATTSSTIVGGTITAISGAIAGAAKAVDATLVVDDLTVPSTEKSMAAYKGAVNVAITAGVLDSYATIKAFATSWAANGAFGETQTARLVDDVVITSYGPNTIMTDGLAVPQFNSICAAFGLASNPCSILELLPSMTTAVGEVTAFLTANSQPISDDLIALTKGLAGLNLLLGYNFESGPFGTGGSLDGVEIFGARNQTELGAIDNAADAVSFIQDQTEYTTLPANWDDSYKVCELMNFVAQTENSTGTGLFFPTVDCTFKNFVVNFLAPTFAPTGAANIASEIAYRLAPDQLGSIEGFTNLFQTCYLATLPLGSAGLIAPGNCYEDLIANVVIAQVYQDEDLATSTTLKADLQKICEDDAKDLEAIEMAQILGPAGTGVIFASALVGVVSLVNANKILPVVAGVLSLAGFGLILGALLGVYNAPVYQSVGGDTEDYGVKYVAGVTVDYGVAAIGLSAASGLLFFLSLLPQLRKGDNVLDAEDKSLKPASL